jgi:hypothetical protein
LGAAAERTLTRRTALCVAGNLSSQHSATDSMTASASSLALALAGRGSFRLKAQLVQHAQHPLVARNLLLLHHDPLSSPGDPCMATLHRECQRKAHY